MDRALYVAMTGATQTEQAQAVNNANLANINTVGFRAELAAASPVPISGSGAPTRVDTVLAPGGFDDSSGSLIATGNPLDVAMRGNNWLAVQAPDGSEAYTRAGNLHVTANGQLVNGAGHPVLGANGSPIAIPPSTNVTIGEDGTVSVIPQGQTAATMATVGRIKVVQAQADQLQRGSDSLFHAAPGVTLTPAAGNTLIVGSLESSNVNPADALVNMIQLSRQFELQVRLMHNVDQNSQAGASLLRLGA